MLRDLVDHKPHQPERPNQGLRRFHRERAMTVMILLSLTGICRGADTSPPREYQIKAHILHQLVDYVEWPKDASAPNSPIVIGLLGRDPFTDAVLKLSDTKLGTRQIRFARYDSAAKLQRCDILVIQLEDPKEVKTLLERLEGTPVLTVSDLDGFTEKGGMINIAKYRNHAKIFINNAAARRAGLKISSLLLACCEITAR